MLQPQEIESHWQRIDRDGYSIVTDAIEAELVDALQRDLERLERALEIVPTPNVFEGANTVRIYNLLVHGSLYERIPVHENVLPLVERVLDSGCLVSSLNSIAICPGERQQLLHTDDQMIPIPKPHPPVVCNAIWALDDFTEANGATRVVPGSHRRDHSPQLATDLGSYRRLVKLAHDATPVLMRKGSVLVYNGSLWHAGGPNRTDRRRTAIAMNYCAGYIRQQENQQLGIPREQAARFSPRLQELIGYSVYNTLIGHIDKRHPAELLGRVVKAGLVWDG